MISIERILCPIDLSPNSDQALRYGVALAHAYEAELLICHCLESWPVDDPSGREQIQKLLASTINDHVQRASLQPVALKSLVVEGDPAEAITREAAERGVDLIVMRSRRRPYAAAVLGSTAEAVCRTAPCPVIVTHPSEREWEGFASGEIKLQRILAAYDFSDLSELALNYSLSLAQEYQAELHLLHVLPSRVKPDGADFAWRQGGAEDEFQQAVRRLQNAVPSEAMLWCHVNQALREGKPYREILAYAEEQDVDLICLGASGKDFGLRALFGSNVDRVLRQAPCPILIARPLRPAQTIAPRHSEPSAPHPAPEKK